MKEHFNNTTLFFSLLIFCAVFTNAQDIIIKNDSTKIQSKVIEQTETTIKYKKWENQDGPVYNIALNEINTIIYANGQKEIIKPSSSNIPVPLANSNDLKNEKVRYKPNRIVIGLQSPLSLGGDKEIGIVRNIFNVGLGTYLYSTPKNDIMPYSFLFSIYGSFYAPLNRLLKNYEKQNKGLFMFAHAGYGLTLIAEDNTSGNPIIIEYDDSEIPPIDEYDDSANPQLITSGGFVWSLGADYYFAKGFGITISTFEFKTYYGGIVFSF